MSHFAKSWGAEPAGNGRWRFSIWAPGSAGMTLRLDGRDHAMERAGEGWFRHEVPAAPGAAYGFLPEGGRLCPDPAARAQVADVHGPSRLVDPLAYDWQTRWRGRPWEETVLYELHVGTFSESGDFDGVLRHLDHLAALGVTAVELCPVAQFSGRRGWGYDGVLLYAPHLAYGGPEGLKRLVDGAHARGLMVFLDVVYNHFGPDGNYLHAYAPDFFQPDRHTPWGAAIAFEREPVRRFFIENALFWLEEYRIDGLRLDAVDQIVDPSEEPVLEALARAVRAHDFPHAVHLTTEDDRNVTFLHERDASGAVPLYNGEWNDDFHHVAHHLATGEADGYYRDYAEDPRGDMMIALGEGYVQQGRPSPYRKGAPRGTPSAHLPPTAFVDFLQNHDQVGNRAFGERLASLAGKEALETLTAMLLLAPGVPLLFMGEEWGETRPFLFFCDFDGELARAVREGRRREFGRWAQFADPAVRETIPDPNDPETFRCSKLDWSARDSEAGRERMALLRELLALRAREIAPRLAGIPGGASRKLARSTRGIELAWRLGDGSLLRMLANLGGELFAAAIAGERLFRRGDTERDRWAIEVTLERAGDAPST